MDTDEPQPRPLTVADLAALEDYIERTSHVDNLKHEARRLIAERWHAVAAAAAGLLVHIDATPYAYPEHGQDPADFARDQLAHAAAAAIWALLAHAVGTGGDDHHLETFTAALINADRLPAAVVEPLAPAFAQLLDAALPAIIASINAPDGPEVIS